MTKPKAKNQKPKAKSPVRKPAPKSKVQSPKSKVAADIRLTGVPMVVEKTDPAMVIQWPRTIVHHHTYGLLSPFFEGLKKGVLRGMRCTNRDCTEKGIWLPPRADCPDCHCRMSWVELKNPVVGEIFTFTHVEYPGHGIEISYPYYQIDVKIPGCCTVMKGYLVRGEAKIGMKVRACFRTKQPTNTILDLSWEPAE
jgi:uncharacterized OB-fold protein